MTAVRVPRDFQPMGAVKADLDNIQYPVYGSPKLDGIRAVIQDGVVLSKRLIRIPNLYVQDLFGCSFLNGLDGELCVGKPTHKNLMQATTSGVMSMYGEPDVTYKVFDYWTDTTAPYGKRLEMLQRNWENVEQQFPRVQLLEQRFLPHSDALAQYEAHCLSLGYEGVMVRNPNGLYKYGDSTVREGYLLKVKRFSDDEAVVEGMVELMHNGNPLCEDARGYAKRSSNAENLVPMNTMGSLRVRDLKTGVRFSIGTGFSAKDRDDWWALGERANGTIVKYKHFKNSGVKDAPRFITYIGIRDPRDL